MMAADISDLNTKNSNVKSVDNGTSPAHFDFFLNDVLPLDLKTNMPGDNANFLVLRNIICIT